MRTKRICGMNSAGQALVEMAILLPLLLLLVMGIFEFGRAMYTKNTLTNAARSGARAAAVSPKLKTDSAAANVNCSYPTYNADDESTWNSTTYEAACKSIYQGIPKDGSTIIFVDVPNKPPQPGDIVTVKVEFDGFKTIVPDFLPIPNKMKLAGETAMRYE